jgi:hypothetical protein
MRISTMMTAAAIVGLAPAAAVAQTAYNSAPTAGWHYGTGNDYSPANSAVLTTDAGDQLFLRWHVTYDQAAASSNTGLYQFSPGQFDLNNNHSLSFDWGFDSSGSGGYDGATLTVDDLGAHRSYSYNAFDPLNLGSNNFNDNYNAGGVVENSARLNFPFLMGGAFDPNADDTYRVTLSVTGLNGGTRSLSTLAQVGAGVGAVPEPASWAMMLGGFGLVGGAMRRRKVQLRFG